MHFTTTLITTLMAFGAHTTALGINCRGSSNCGLLRNGDANLGTIVSRANNAGDNHVFGNGEHIACVAFGGVAGGSLCAFPQGTSGGISGRRAKELLLHLQNHRCSTCGSVPVGFPQDNDVSTAGMLTVNWVR
ncbi:killer toxin [Sporormia fimetaria CBS 119925]|uniref:Killer toxin n=1 Tax=Sporormia fimetaria CBS 119925 TaxID=1340428 RepID=A0A6A6V539_9PLEO|nr:killer toxin [Sporormia fimetaria CBS 119925]